MADQSVGQVSVLVVPDADNFGKQAEAELKRQRIDPKNVSVVPVIDANMAKLSSQISAIAKSLDRTSTISVNTDFSGVRGIDGLVGKILPPDGLLLHASWDPTSEAGLRKTLQQIEDNFSVRHELLVDASTAQDAAESIRKTLAEIEAEKVRIAAEIVLDEAATKARLQEAARRMSTALRVNAQFDFDDSRITQDMDRLRAETAEWKASLERDAQVKVDLDKGRAEQSFRELQAYLEERGTVSIGTRIERTSREVVAASLAALTRTRTVQIEVGRNLLNITSVLSGFDALNKSVSQAHEAFTGLFTNLPQVAAATTGIFAMSGALLSSAANMAGLAGSAAQALPVLLAMGGVAVGFAITAAAFKDFGTVLPGVAEQFKGLQKVISDAFWAPGTGAIAGIQSFSASIMGPLTAGLQQASGAIGGFVGNLATQLGDALGGSAGPLAAWFANLTASVQAFEPFIANIVSIFTQFGNVGSAMLVPLAELVGSLVERFDLWFQSLVAAEGGIEGFALKSVGALAGIIETVIQIGAIFGAVFRAAEESGAASFTSLAETLKGVAQSLNENKGAMVALFDAAQQGWTNFKDAAGGSIGEAFGNIAVLLQAVLPVVGAITGTITKLLAGLITPEVMFGIQQFVLGISSGLEAMKPAIAPLAGLLATLGPVLGTLAEVIGGVFGALAPSITGIVQALGPLIEKLGGGLLTIITKLQKPIELLATALADALSNPAMMAAIDAIVNAIVALIPALTPIIAMAASLVTMLMPLVAVILEPIAGLISQLVPLFAPLTTVILAIVGAITPLIPILVNLVTAVLEPILPLIVSLASAILPLLVPIIQVIATVLQLVMSLLTPLIEAILPPLAGILNIIINVLGLVATAIIGVFGAAITWISEQIGKVSEGISAFFDKWQEIWNKVAEFFKGVWDGLLNWIKDLLGIHSPSSWFLDLATNMLTGMLNGLKAAWEWIVAFFTGAWDWLKTTFTNAFNAYKDIVLKAWDAIKRFFSDAWEGLKAIVSGGWDKVKQFFSDAATNIRTTVSDVWTKVKTFFSDGITNAVNLVKGLPGKVLGALSGIGSTLYSAGRDLIQGLINGASSLLSGIGNWFLSKLPAWIRDPFKAALGINSPSTVFFGFGENIIEGLIEGMESQHRKVFRSMDDLAGGVADTEFNLPNVTGGGLAALASMVAATTASGSNRTLNYYAAPGSSIDSEEDLFAAAGRGRMVW